MARPYSAARCAALFFIVSLSSACAGQYDSVSYNPPQSLVMQSARQAAACPSGQIKVCDRRRGVGCLCRSARHLRAAIGA